MVLGILLRSGVLRQFPFSSFGAGGSKAWGLRRDVLFTVEGVGFNTVDRAPKKHISKIRIGISHINPLLRKPNKVGISPVKCLGLCAFGGPLFEAQGLPLEIMNSCQS